MSMNKKCCRKRLLTILLVVVMTLLASEAALAANMINKARKNVHTEGTFAVSAKGKRYVLPDGKYLKNTWASIGGNIYSFKKNGAVRTGWFTYKNQTYYADETGSVYYDRSVMVGGATYYLLKNGQKAQNCWVKIDGQKYYVNESGIRNPYPVSGVKYLFVGDSRIHGMYLSMPQQVPEVAFIYKDSSGYSYLTGDAQIQLKVYLQESPNVKVIFGYGINDIGNLNSYIAYYQSVIAAYPRATFYIMSVNPMSKSNQWVNNKMIKAFNKDMKKAFRSRYLPVYTYLKKSGFQTFDGVHYTAETSQKIYQHVRSLIG